MLSVNQRPKVSIIMPMYNVEKYIGKSIQSVISQDFHDWELLIVNDGSPDNSREIAANYAASDARIKILDKENGGLSDARKFGLSNATGEYVHFFDSDDWIESDFYSNLLCGIDNFDLVVCGYKVDNEKSCIERRCVCGKLDDYNINNLHSLVSLYLNFAWNKLFRRSFLVKNALFYERGLYRIEDSEFISRFLKFNPKVFLIEYTGYHYMVRGISTLSNVFDENIFNHLERSIFIHSSIYHSLSNDNTFIQNEITIMSVNAIKSVLYKMLEDVPIFKIKKNIFLINKLLAIDIFTDFSQCKSRSLIDRMVIRAIVNKSWIKLLIVSQLNKVRKGLFV